MRKEYENKLHTKVGKCTDAFLKNIHQQIYWKWCRLAAGAFEGELALRIVCLELGQRNQNGI